MRGRSLRLKINAAIFFAFAVAALGFGAVLRLNVADRLALAHHRAQALMAAVAAHRLEALVPLLEQGQDRSEVQDALAHLTRANDIHAATLFNATGVLLAHVGPEAPAPLVSDGLSALPSSRAFIVSEENKQLTATLIEPIPGANGNLGFLRLRASLHRIHELNQRLWWIFALAVSSAYALLAVLLNILLHRLVLRPADTLRQALESVKCGRLDTTIPVRTQDVLGRAALAFNAMAARLAETSRRLGAAKAELEHQQQLLEVRVRTRTAELAEANDKLRDEVEARRQAEHSLGQALAQRDALLANTQVGLVTVRFRAFAEINPRGAAILGCAREDLLGQPVGRIFPDEAAYQRIAQAIKTSLAEEDTVTLETRLRRPDGTLLWARLHGKRFNEATDQQETVWAFDDISQEKEQQGQLERARLQAEDAARAKGSFLAVMSHEIRTPLNVIMGLTDLLLDREAPAEQHGYLRTIKESTGHLIGVLDEILDFSKIEAGKLVLERRHFDLPDLLAAVGRAMDVQAARKGLRFALTTAADLPRTLLGDPGRLRQVLLNLLSNAVKFTDKGAVTLTVARLETGEARPAAIGLAFRVEDTGIGIGPERLPGLFSNFQQGSGSIARRYGGTGLGLAISKKIVESLGGHIEVLSRPDQGSVFSFTVFMAPGDPGQVAPAALEPGGDASPPPDHRRRILLVEDNALNAAVTRLHMERMGHDLTVVTSAREAFLRLAQERYAVVLMDIEMPDIDGITATRTIRAGGPPEAPTLDPAVPIVAATAHAVEDIRRQCLAAGMDGFVTKPVNYQALQSLLDSLGQRTAPVETVTPAPAPDLPLFDPEAARKAMGIDWDQYVTLHHVSFREGGQRLAEAGQALASGDLSSAVIAVHTFKGTAATLGAYSSRDLAVSLERDVRSGDLERARERFAALTALWEEVSRALAAWKLPTAPRDPTP